MKLVDGILFQSTHLLRGGTARSSSREFISVYFNPPTSCEVGRAGIGEAVIRINISIHPPPARWDSLCCFRSASSSSFQSTHLLRGGTRGSAIIGQVASISIHPPPARWDSAAMPVVSDIVNFNPPTSCEVGRQAYKVYTDTELFQSTHLLRGGTVSAG